MSCFIIKILFKILNDNKNRYLYESIVRCQKEKVFSLLTVKSTSIEYIFNIIKKLFIYFLIISYKNKYFFRAQMLNTL